MITKSIALARTITPTEMDIIEQCRTAGGKLYWHGDIVWKLYPENEMPFRPGFAVRTEAVKRLIDAGVFRVADIGEFKPYVVELV